MPGSCSAPVLIVAASGISSTSPRHGLDSKPAVTMCLACGSSALRTVAIESEGEGKAIGRTYRRYFRAIECHRLCLDFRPDPGVLASTRLNTKVLPIPSSDCFRSAHLVVSVRRNRLISSYSWELSVRRCFNDGHSEHASSGTS